ncbi:MAG TPA: methyltransferase domain-containing protein [Candidatus Dormibacteraeota bacterium]|nr:methyltransferase domain-containing protein [Candidatus Dormibacteraeota bacterium]
MTGQPSFAGGAQPWLASLGRLREVVRQELLSAQLREQLGAVGPPPLRVLDAGCGQGTQALRLAQAGHRVTGLDPGEELLAHFAATLAGQPPEVRDRITLVRGAGEEAPALVGGDFDAVLCHGVLMYCDDPAPLLAALTSVARADGGLLSLLVRNGLAMAMRAGLSGSWAEALDAFDRPDYVNRLGLAARAHTLDELDAAMAVHRWVRRGWYGVRVFTDHLDAPAPDADELGVLVRAEDRAGRRDPYRSVAALLHVLYSGPAAG